MINYAVSERGRNYSYFPVESKQFILEHSTKSLFHEMLLLYHSSVPLNVHSINNYSFKLKHSGIFAVICCSFCLYAPGVPEII